VFDIALRALEGILVNSKTYGLPLGDGVNVSSSSLGVTFPFVGLAYNGRNSVHEGPGQAGCVNQAGGLCPIN
jgi:hypothetical protein